VTEAEWWVGRGGWWAGKEWRVGRSLGGRGPCFDQPPICTDLQQILSQCEEAWYHEAMSDLVRE
jgi:hypothetical protein